MTASSPCMCVTPFVFFSLALAAHSVGLSANFVAVIAVCWCPFATSDEWKQFWRCKNCVQTPFSACLNRLFSVFFYYLSFFELWVRIYIFIINLFALNKQIVLEKVSIIIIIKKMNKIVKSDSVFLQWKLPKW